MNCLVLSAALSGKYVVAAHTLEMRTEAGVQRDMLEFSPPLGILHLLATQPDFLLNGALLT